MKTYELTYIVSPEITSEEAGAKAREIESTILSKEGIILKQSNPVAKTLSYPIKKRASGFLGVLEFQLEPEKLIELKEILAGSGAPSGSSPGKIVRHMVIIKEAAKIRKEKMRASGAPRIKPAGPGSPSGSSPESYPFEIEQKTDAVAKEDKPSFNKVPKGDSASKEKVELKDIEQKLDELLGE